MLKIGSYNELVVQRMVEYGLYLNSGKDEVLLPSKYIPKNTGTGDTLRVFVYTDSEDRPIATTLDPMAVLGDFAYLRVKDVTSFGAFIDWGLEKDLFIPKSEQQSRMKPGMHNVVKICLDTRTNRVYGTCRITPNCDKNLTDLRDGEKVNLLIYDITKIGIMAVVNNRYAGMLYRNETYVPVAVGDKINGYVSRIRNDGKIDLSLKQPGYGSITGSGKHIMETLAKWDGFIPCHDKSTPEEINRTFSMSKKEFKRAAGRLYKNGKIQITDRGIHIK